ncbi:MAG: hypothetical protein ACTHMT_05745 [Verrucomicrobiota bacterium]
MTQHTCKAPGCSKVISSRFLMCPVHWAQVPLRLQRAVNRAWSGGDASDYLAARAAAIEFLTPKDKRKAAV